MGMEIDLHGVVNRAVSQALLLSEPPPPATESRTKVPLAVGEFFAKMAEREGASVESFRGQILELEQLNSPADLIEHARDAVRCEERHHEQVVGLALRFGAQPERPSCSDPAPRDLYDFALHNATHGCVRQTFVAAQLTHQSRMARDEEVRRVLRSLASDETRHSAFFWKVHLWAVSQLSPARGRNIRAAQREAFAELRGELEEKVPKEVADWIGVARGPAVVTLLDSIEGELWPAD